MKVDERKTATRSCRFGSGPGLDLLVAVAVFCVLFMAVEPGAEAGVGANEIRIEHPKSNAHVSGQIDIKLKAGRNIKQVFVYVDDKYITSGPPYTVSWNSETVSNGPHKIIVAAATPMLTSAESLQVSQSRKAANFFVHNPLKVKSLTLIDTDTNQPIPQFNPIVNGSTINLATLPSHNLTIQANTSPTTVGSVVFDLVNSRYLNTVNTAPYDLCGTVPCSNLGVGSYSLKSTAYTGFNGSGRAGSSMSIGFSVIDPTSTPAPNPTSTPAPKPTSTPAPKPTPTPNPAAATYYIAPGSDGGNDNNSGTDAGHPWLTPNHALNCGDVILAAAGTYDEANFRPGNWGMVTCATGDNVAWLKCGSFDTCKILITKAGHDAMTPTQSYWGVQGWEVTALTASTNACFEAYPPDFVHTIHHIVFANNFANGCGDGAFTSGASASNVGVDYLAIIGNIAYNAAQDNANCYSGIDIVAPVNYDTLSGTHIYIAGNYSWGNIDPNPCAGGAPTDGQGISLDTVNAYSYSGQIVIDNNISVFNGGTGIQSFLNAGSSPNAPIYIRHNTTYGNQTGKISASPCAEINLASSLSTQVYSNLVETAAATACDVLGSAQTLYALGVSSPASTDQLYSNFLYSASGSNTTGSGPGFSYGDNLTGTDPDFAKPVKPSAPSCSGFASVPACTATLIANFTPTNSTAAPYGYQVPSKGETTDPLFPQWLCNVNLPSGLVTMGCLSSQPASAINLSPTTE